MALRSTVLNEDNILCELYVDTCSDVSDNGENEILDSDSNVPTTSLHKQLRPSAIVFTSNSETSTEEEESSEPGSSDDKKSDMPYKTDEKWSNEPFLRYTGLDIIIDNTESFVEVMSSITRDDLMQLFIEQSTLYHIKMH